MPRPPRRSKSSQFSLAQIEPGERFESLCYDLLQSLGYDIVRAPNRGSDRGVDMIAAKSITDDLGFIVESRIAVECKHFAKSGRSVTEASVGNIIERTLSHNCNRYLLITSTIASSTLAHQIEGINNNPSIPIKAAIWSSTDIERFLQRYEAVAERYFPPQPDPTLEINKDLFQDTRPPEQIVAIHLHPDFTNQSLI